MKQFGLYKKEKLCSAIAIDKLFGAGGSDFATLSYPLRLVARRNDARHSDAPVAFLISVPKKRLRHAVDRVLMRRRIREAYRLSERGRALGQGLRLDVAFVYVANKTLPYSSIETAMARILDALSAHFTHTAL